MQKIISYPKGHYFKIGVESVNEDPSLTDQQFQRECDINYIVKRHAATGALPVSRVGGVFADLTGVANFDYQESLNLILAAQDSFMELPAEMRSRFNNDPSQLLQFLSDPKNDPEAISLGLKIPKSNDDLTTNQKSNSAPSSQASSQSNPS